MSGRTRGGRPKDRRGRRAGRARVETSAGGVVYLREEQDLRFLLIRDPYGHWGLPKGHIEGEETPEEAALREVAEETGLEELRLGDALPRIDWFFRARGRLIHKFCHFFLVESMTDATCPREEEGISECVWRSYPDAVEMISYDNAREVLRAAGERLGLDESRQP